MDCCHYLGGVLKLGHEIDNGAIRQDQGIPADSASKCKNGKLHVYPGAFVCGRDRVQVEGAARRVRQLEQRIYIKANRWAKASVLERVFAALQKEQIIAVTVEVLALDSTSIKVHPDAHGAFKNEKTSHREVEGRLEHQTSCGIRR